MTGDRLAISPRATHRGQQKMNCPRSILYSLTQPLSALLHRHTETYDPLHRRQKRATCMFASMCVSIAENTYKKLMKTLECNATVPVCLHPCCVAICHTPVKVSLLTCCFNTLQLHIIVALNKTIYLDQNS